MTHSRRDFLSSLARLAVTGAAVALSPSALASVALAAQPKSRRLCFAHTHTGKSLDIVYAVGDRYLNPMPLFHVGGLQSFLLPFTASGGKVVLMFAGNEKYYKDGAGHFSLTKWKQRIDRFRIVVLTDGIAGGALPSTIESHKKSVELDPELREGYYGLGQALKQQAATTTRAASSNLASSPPRAG
mgnify:CR=1 FL=1